MATDKKAKKYEIRHGQIRVGNEVRIPGQTITKGEISDASLEMLIREQLVIDADAPLTASTVNSHVGDHFIEVAESIGLITNKSGVFSFEGRDFKGREQLRQEVLLTELKAAFVKAYASKSAAIGELTEQLAAAKQLGK